jgi:hypothetical protein
MSAIPFISRKEYVEAKTKTSKKKILKVNPTMADTQVKIGSNCLEYSRKFT